MALELNSWMIQLSLLLLAAVGLWVVWKLIRRAILGFRRWVFLKSGYFETLQVETLNRREFLEGEGYLLITPRLVEFRRGAPRSEQFQSKRDEVMQSVREQIPGGVGTAKILDDHVYPKLLTQEEAKALSLDLETARKDAKLWWKVGFIPPRPTPIMHLED